MLFSYVTAIFFNYIVIRVLIEMQNIYIYIYPWYESLGFRFDTYIFYIYV